MAYSRPTVAEQPSERAQAFLRLADEHLDGAYRLARAILRDSIDAQDATHDAFEQAWRKWSTLRDLARFEPWFDLPRCSRRPFVSPDAARRPAICFRRTTVVLCVDPASARQCFSLERVVADNGSEFRSTEFGATVRELGAHQTVIRACRPARSQL